MLSRNIVLTGDTCALEVVNSLEATRFVYLDSLPLVCEDRQTVYENLFSELCSEDGKYYVVTNPMYAVEWKNYIEDQMPGYLYSLVKKTNLMIACKKPEYEEKEENLSDNWTLNHLSAASGDLLIRMVSEFQTKLLKAMRPGLSEDEAEKKLNSRYGFDALKTKATSGNIIVFYACNEDSVVGTFTINMHNSSGVHIAYASDLILEKDCTETTFPERLVLRVLKEIYSGKILPDINAVTLMAPGNEDDPLVTCLNGMKARGIFDPLCNDIQEEKGIVPYFVQGKNPFLQNSGPWTPVIVDQSPIDQFYSFFYFKDKNQADSRSTPSDTVRIQTNSIK